MKRLLLLLLPVLLESCGPNEILVDRYSPDGKFHVQVRKCPDPTALGASAGQTEVSVLPLGQTEACGDDIKALAQFTIQAPADRLELEWLSNSQLRAWDPEFTKLKKPNLYSMKDRSPIAVVFAPTK